MSLFYVLLVLCSTCSGFMASRSTSSEDCQLRSGKWVQSGRPPSFPCEIFRVLWSHLEPLVCHFGSLCLDFIFFVNDRRMAILVIKIIKTGRYFSNSTNCITPYVNVYATKMAEKNIFIKVCRAYDDVNLTTHSRLVQIFHHSAGPQLIWERQHNVNLCPDCALYNQE